MRKVYLDMQFVSSIPDAYLRSADEIAKLAGLNLGNFVFRHALRSIVDRFEEYEPMDYPALSKLDGETEIDHVLVSAANWLGTSAHDESSNKVRADLFQKIKAPISCFGLGVQAPHNAAAVDLGPQTARLAKVLSEGNNKLAVRDELTANTLEKIGIKNAEVLGCPSNFINTDPRLGEKVKKKCENMNGARLSARDLRFMLSECSGGNKQSVRVLHKICEILDKFPAFYILQDPAPVSFLINHSEDLPPLYNQSFGYEPGEVKRLLLTNGLYFSSVEAWLDFARTCSLALGMRIHGTMVGLQAGIPSLLIAHDSRTKGLATTMGVPVAECEEFVDCVPENMEFLINRISQAMSSYDRVRADLARQLIGNLRANKLAPSAALLDFTKGQV